MGVAVPFPTTQPAGYEWFDDEPPFDPDRHLQLEDPTEVVMLADLGYDQAEIATKATPMAASSPFRLLSDEGAAVMLATARKLRGFARAAGGHLEYFLGTKQEAAELAAEGHTPPPERTIAPDFRGPGHAVAMQGDMVVHRAGPLTEPCERISLVSAYVALDTSVDEQSRTADLIIVDDHEALWTEWAKMAAWISRGRLQSLIDEIEFTSDRDAVVARLESAVADVQKAIDEMRAGERMTEHYGG